VAKWTGASGICCTPGLGKKQTVFGRLRVIEHEAAVVNRVLVPVWREIRINEG
jgi:hypothetical protein